MRFTVGDILGEAWILYTRHTARLVAIAAVAFGFLSLVQAAVDVSGRRELLAVSIGVTIVGATWVQGALVVAVADIRDGKVDLSIGDVFRRVEPRLWALLGAALVVGLTAAAGFVLFIVPGLVVITFWSLVTPAVVLERLGVVPAIGRSQRLVSGDFWRVLAVVVVTIVFATIVNVVVVAVLTPLPTFVDTYIAGVVGNSITIPFVALAWTLMFYELRAIKG